MNNNNQDLPELPGPDDRLREVDEQPSGDGELSSEGGAVGGFILLKLHGYYKPPLAEELATAEGGAGACSCNSVCTCVPVQTCACDSVCTCNSVETGTSCSHSGGCGGGGGYYAPCF